MLRGSTPASEVTDQPVPFQCAAVFPPTAQMFPAPSALAPVSGATRGKRRQEVPL